MVGFAYFELVVYEEVASEMADAIDVEAEGERSRSTGCRGAWMETTFSAPGFSVHAGDGGPFSEDRPQDRRLKLDKKELRRDSPSFSSRAHSFRWIHLGW